MERSFIQSGRRLLGKIYTGLAFAATVMLFGLCVTAGAETGAFTVTGGVEGTDYEYASGVLTILTQEELTISTSSSTTDRIDIAGSAGANIILDGVTINNASHSQKGALIISGNGDVTVTLAEGSLNTLVAGESCAAVQKDGSGKLTITGSGELKAVGGMYAAGIGGKDGETASDIEISGGLIDVKGGTFAAGLGGGYGGHGKNITISGGAVTADSSGGASIGGGYNSTAENIVITGGTVLAKSNTYTPQQTSYTCPGIGGGLSKLNNQEYKNGVAVAPLYSDGREVHLLVVPNPTNSEVKVDGAVFTPSQHPGDTKLYLYLTPDEHTITVGGVETDYFFNPESGEWTQPGTEFVITGEGLRHGTDFIYPADTGVLTILTDKAMNIANADPTTATDNIIVVADGVSADITLDGINIEATGSAALQIVENTAAGNVTVTLKNGTTNTLKASGEYAALEKEGENGTLIITGGGKLIAQGGICGIGGESAHNITIKDTTVKASGGSYGGAGIGGTDGTVSKITISGSEVEANGADGGAGIGSVSGAVSDIVISSSSVTAAGSGSAAGIGGGTTAAVQKITIDGGSVKATAGGSGTYAIGGSSAVVPANKLENFVYLLVIDNDDEGTVLIDGVEYVPQRHSMDDPDLYVYLPADEYVVTIDDTDTPYYFDNSTKTFRSPELKVTGGRLNEDYIFEAGTVTVISDKPLSIENFDKNTPANDTIAVKEGITANITLTGVNIDSADVALQVGDGGVANITLAADAENTLASDTGAIVGDDVSVIFGGSGQLSVAGGITGGVGSIIRINSGSLTADSINANKVIIDGGSVKVTTVLPAPENSEGDKVYLLKINNSADKDVYIDDVLYLPRQHGIDGDENVYAYLTGEVHTVTLAKTLTYHFDSLASRFYLPDLNVYGDNVVYGTDYTYSDGVVTILTATPMIIENIDPANATSDSIEIISGIDADITLDGVNIAADHAAIDVSDNGTGNVTITLAENSENKLSGGAAYAAVQKNGTIASLEITGEGSLVAKGGYGSAAIGSVYSQATGNITISGGVITATAGSGGAGIGGGDHASATGITIKGNAEVTATGDAGGAGIGAGSGGNASDIEINGGNVNATGGAGAAGIGGGSGGTGSGIVVNGGSVTAEGDVNGACLGGGNNAVGSDIIINGGSVKTISGANAFGGGAGKDAVIPENSDGDEVYLLIIANPDNKTVLIDGVEYLPRQHGSTDSNIYVYLTGENHTVKLGNEAAKTYIYDQYNKMFVVIASDLIVSGGMYGLDYTYPVSDGVLTILTDKPMTISNSADVDVTDHRIVVDAGVDAVLTLDGVNISTGGAAFAADGGSVTVTAADGSENCLISAGTAGFAINGTGQLTICGKGTIKISGTSAAVNAEDAAVIIDNGIVTAAGGIRADAVTIKGGSIKADVIAAAPTNGTSAVYLLKIANPDNKTVKINGTAYVPKQHGIDNDTNVYAYLTGETQAVEIDGTETVYIFDDDTDQFRLPELIVTGTNVRFGTDYTYANGVVSILSEKSMTISNNPDVAVSSDRIECASGITANITLDGVNISLTSGIPLTVNGSADISTESAMTNTLFSDDNAGIIVTSAGVLKLSGSGEIAADIAAAGGTVSINEGSVTADSINADKIMITGGSVKAGTLSVAPVDDNGNVYLLVIPNPNGETVTVNNETYLPKYHNESDKNIYAYLSGTEDQALRIGGDKITYRYSETKAKFLVVPAADMFDVTLPAELTYNGTPKIVGIDPDDDSITYTVKYYNENGDKVDDTSATGKYTFTITVIGDDTYADEVLSDNRWTFEVTGAPLDPPASVAFTVGYGYKAEDAVFDTSTGAMAVGNTVVSGQWKLVYDEHFTTSGNTYTSVFAPDDSNYLSFTFTSTQVTVTAVDPVVKADPAAPRVIPGKSVSFTVKAEHPAYPEFTEGLPSVITSISDGNSDYDVATYTVARDAEINSTITITLNIAAVDGRYNASQAQAVITVAEKLRVNDQISVQTDTVIYGNDPEPQGIFSGEADGVGEWSYSFAAGDTGENGSFGPLQDIYNEYGALDVGTYTVKARYEDAAHIGVGYGTFTVTAKELGVRFNGDITKIYDGTKAVVGYDVDAADFVLSGLVGGAQRTIDTLGVTILYKDENAGDDKELIIAIINDDHVVAPDGGEDINYTVPDSIDFTGATITRRPVTVTAEAASRTYGEDDPVFTYQVDDIVRGESLTGELSREQGEDAGEYDILQGTVTNDNNANYDITFVSAVLTIGKAAAPADVMLDAKHSWGAYGERTLAVTGLPEDMGGITAVQAVVTDEDDIMADTASYADGMVTYQLNSNTKDMIGSTAQITLTVSCRNYEDFTVIITVTLTAKEDQEAPALDLTFELQPDGTFTATIAAVEGAEYKFGDGEWTTVNYITGVEPSTYVTAYIRMAETDTHNASAAASVTELSPKSTVLDPVFTPVASAFNYTMDVVIRCDTVGATILYTTDGSDPFVNGTVYTEPIYIEYTTIIKAVAIKDAMLDSNVVESKYNKLPNYSSDNGVGGGSGSGSGSGSGNSSGDGSGGGSGDGPSGGSDATSGYGESPSINGTNRNWYQIADTIMALPIGGEMAVELNGCIDVPDFVIKAIADRDAHITFEYSSLHHWHVDGKDISDTEELVNADMDIIYPVRLMTYDLRGKAKFKFRIDNTNIPTTFVTDVDIKNAGEFANLYRFEDGVPVFVACVMIDENGIARLPLTEKGDYALMASKYSDLLGDVNNEGRVNALDAGAVLRHVVGIEEASNIEMGDFNADGNINALDAAGILSWIVGATA